MLHFSTQGFAAFNVALVIAWLVVGLMLVQQHRGLAREASVDAAA
jgi:preprotein translocase subunit SecG